MRRRVFYQPAGPGRGSDPLVARVILEIKMTFDEGGLLEKVGAHKVNRVADLEEGIGHPGSPRGDLKTGWPSWTILGFLF